MCECVGVLFECASHCVSECVFECLSARVTLREPQWACERLSVRVSV